MPLLSRRRFLACTVGVAGFTPALSSLVAASAPAIGDGAHPTPRPGITAERVATREQLAATPHVVEVFDLVREVPAIADGIRCQCGCAELGGYRSLLTCFEAPDMMAAHCPICQAQARLVHRMHKAGRALDEIRRGVDARFG